MRTTLTLEPDVAAMLEQVRKTHGLSLKETVNEALRQGFTQMLTPPPSRKPFRVEPLPIQRFLLPNVDDIHEVLAYGEGEDYR
ncbi:MAG TPA: hypothetical protein VFC93_09000 [Chloroflexota bacterium]|nr:hypothetical protein [Chloroflexota bacterium]